MGWPAGRQDIILGGLKGAFDELKLDHYEANVLPLQDGGKMRFRYKKPDFREPTAIEIIDRERRLTRGWSTEGEVLECDRMKFSSPEQLFLIRKNSGRYLLAGGKLTVSACGNVKSVSLVDPISGRVFGGRPAWRLDGKELTAHLDGRQRLMAVAITVDVSP